MLIDDYNNSYLNDFIYKRIILFTNKYLERFILQKSCNLIKEYYNRIMKILLKNKILLLLED